MYPSKKYNAIENPNDCEGIKQINNKKIASITGYSFPINIPLNYKYDVYMFYRCMSWGWATWYDRWGKVDWNINEKNKFIKKYGKQIPKILLDDPIVKYFNFKQGDVLKIVRRNNYISYRIVVNE